MPQQQQPEQQPEDQGDQPKQTQGNRTRVVSSNPNDRSEQPQPDAEQQQGNPHGTPPGQQPGQGQATAPGQQKPRAEQQQR